MRRSYKVVCTAVIVLLAGISAVLAIQFDRKSARVDDQAQEPHTSEVVSTLAAASNVAEPQTSPSAATLTPTVRAGEPAPPERQPIWMRAKANPKPPTSPEHLAAHRAEERNRARREYSPLFEMLNLSQQQEDDFLEVLVAEAVEEVSPAEYQATRGKRARDRTEKITAIVGADKVQVYEDFLRNLAEHTRVTQIGMQLDASGVPLSKQQKAFLVQLMVAERERVPQPSLQKPISTTADIERELDWMADQDRRVREGAASMLSTKQLRYLDETLAARLAKRRIDLSRIPVVN